MRSTTAPSVLLLLLAAAAAAGEEAAPRTLVLGWIASPDAAVSRDLEDGMRLALETRAAPAGCRVVLRRGEAVGTWGTVAASAARLVSAEKALVLLAPPERDASHLLLQVGTKMRVPVVATSRAPTVTQTGTTWVVRVVPRGAADAKAPEPPPFDAADPAAREFVRAFRARHGRAPGPWAAAAYDAACAALAALDRTAGRGGTALRDALRALDGPPGAAGPIRFDERGDRVVAAAR